MAEPLTREERKTLMEWATRTLGVPPSHYDDLQQMASDMRAYEATVVALEYERDEALRQVAHWEADAKLRLGGE